MREGATPSGIAAAKRDVLLRAWTRVPQGSLSTAKTLSCVGIATSPSGCNTLVERPDIPWRGYRVVPSQGPIGESVLSSVFGPCLAQMETMVVASAGGT